MLLALWLSKPLRWAVMGLAAMGIYEGWKFHQRNIGAERVTAQITKKADNDALTANEVRADAAAGKPAGRVRSPYERREDAGQ